MSDKFVCPFEDAVVYRIPDNYAQNYGSGENGWIANSACVTHKIPSRILNDIDELHYGTPLNGMEQVNPDPKYNI